MKSGLIILIIVCAIITSPASVASTKGCVNVFKDGSEICRPAQIGSECFLRKGQSMFVDGKEVVRRYQVNRCKGYDGLGGKIGATTNNAFGGSSSCENKNKVMFTCADRCAPRAERIEQDSPAGRCVSQCMSQNGCKW